jgi:sugar lactone lactonase YvrE
MNGVRVFAPDGTPLGAIVVPEVAANLCFGGHHHNWLFIRASTSIYAWTWAHVALSCSASNESSRAQA